MVWEVILILYLTYLFVSLVLFIFPSAIHSKHATFAKRILGKKNKIAVFSHRGGALEAPENSMTAFRHSIDIGITGIETDIMKTRDNVYVTSHDSRLMRLTGQQDKFSEIDYEDIGPFLSVMNVHMGNYELKDKEKEEKPGKLLDLFKAVKNTNIVLSLDVKTGEIEDIRNVLRLCKENHIHDRVIIGNMFKFNVKELKKEFGNEINFFFPGRQVFYVFIYFMTGLLPFIPLKHDFFMITHAFHDIMNNPFFDGRWFLKCVFGFIRCIWPFIALLNWHLKRRGIVVFYWTVNSIKDVETSLKLGAQGVITDKPEFIKEYLESKDLF